MTPGPEGKSSREVGPNVLSRRQAVRRMGLAGAVTVAASSALVSPAAADVLPRTEPRRFRMAPNPGPESPDDALASRGYVDGRVAAVGESPWVSSDGVLSAVGDVSIAGKVTLSGVAKGLAGGVAYHNTDLRNGQVARDLIVTLSPHSRYSSGDHGTFLCTWSNRAGHSVYILNFRKDWNQLSTVTLTKLAGNLSSSFTYVTHTYDLTVIRLVLGVSNGTHQSSSASFTAHLIGDSRGRGAPVTWVPTDR